jgi:hypothetical protein
MSRKSATMQASVGLKIVLNWLLPPELD